MLTDYLRTFQAAGQVTGIAEYLGLEPGAPAVPARQP